MRRVELRIGEWLRAGCGRQEGQGMVEYALILVLIAVVVIVIVRIVGQQVSNVFSNVSSGLGERLLNLPSAAPSANLPVPAGRPGIGCRPSALNARGPPRERR